MSPLMSSIRRVLARPLPWVLLFGALIVYGVYAWLHIPVEVLPRFDYPQISIITRDPGATAQELEARITRPIEGQILALHHLASLRSRMGHGEVQTTVRFTTDTHPQQDLQSVYSAIDRVRGQLPAAAHPYAELMGNAINEVADYAAQIPAGVAPVAVQRAIRASIEPALRALPGVQRVEVYGTGHDALWVQPDLPAMHHYGVPVTALTAALKQHVLLRSGGYIHAGHQHVLIEARNLPRHAAALGQIPVQTRHGPVALHDLAHVERAPEPTRNAIKLDGRASIALTVFKQPGASTQPVDRAVQAKLKQTLGQLPHGVHWVRIYNQGHLVGLIGADLGRNLVIGAALAILVLFWILGAGRGIWALALSIPLSLLLGIAGLYAFGESLNLLTLGALSVAVGLLADDGIIVLEAIYHRWEAGDAHWAGIRQGLADIASPDISGSLTTVSVFLPLLFVGGLAGLFFIPFALAMALAIGASLFISLTVIPLGLGFIGARPRMRPTAAARALDRLQGLNERLFDRVTRFPRASLAGCVALLLISAAGLVLVSVNFLPLPNEGDMLIGFSLPPGTSLHQTEAAVDTITQRLRADPAVAHTYARIGSASATAYTEPGYAGEIQTVLKPGIGVNSLNQLGQRLLKEGRIPGVEMAIDTPTIERLGESLSGLPQPFVLRVFGHDISKLRSLAKKIGARLRHVPSLTSIFNNDSYPIPQLQLKPKPGAMTAYGLTPSTLYAQIDPLLTGDTVAQIPDGNVPLDLYVRLAQAPDLSLAGLRQLPIHTRHGWTPLGQLAQLKLIDAPNQLRHVDGARALDILATPTGSLGSAVSGARKAIQGLHLPPGYRIGFGGLYPKLMHAAIGIGIAAIAAFVLMVGILIIQFDGLLAPGLLLLQIPLAFTGGVLALVLSGVGLNATGLVAFLALLGLSLNHGIVLLFRVRRNEAAGQPVAEAVREAVRVRFRPIVLTTLTAVLGMLPTALGWGQGAAPEQGLAIVILGGMIWSALLTTNLIPALYLSRRQKQAG
ncbi:efflux RND transporter permease subunit [Salinisphaera sp. SWV1]|uniref:efflux RND transporter permease subunit n=1 Tax=Salinisphaera sp. SWV1 TaxID=3454139 RepID=UPI003F86ABB1